MRYRKEEGTTTTYYLYEGSSDVSYTGKERDQTGLYYFNARYYDASIGRFITEDPARNGMNWFVYCGNNLITLIDKDGNTPIKPTPILGMKAHDAFGAYVHDVLSRGTGGVLYDTPLGSIAGIVERFHQIPEIDETSNLRKRPDITVVTPEGLEIYELKPISCERDPYKHKKALKQLSIYIGFFMEMQKVVKI